MLELPQEDWSIQILSEIARAISTPLIIDSANQNKIFGHYARVLVDADFSRCILDEIVVERDGFAFKLAVEYEWKPDFCLPLSNYSHNVIVCRWIMLK